MTPQHRILQALSLIGDDLIAEAAKPPKGVPWRKAAAVAACLALTIGLFGSMGGKGGGTGDGDLYYDKYVGPVLPMTTLSVHEGLTAERTVTYDFDPYDHIIAAAGESGGTSIYTHYTHVGITDAYTLNNPTDSPMTVTAVYPVTGSLSDRAVMLPTVTAEGAAVTTQLMIGGVLEDVRDSETLTARLSDGSYFDRAFAPAVLPAEAVTVYRIGNVRYDGPIGDNPTLFMEFTAPAGTRLLTYNCSAISHKDGQWAVTVNRASAGNNGDSYVLFVEGDADAYALRGYTSPARDPDTETQGFTAEVRRYETTLTDFLRASVDWQEWRTVYNNGLQKCIADGLSDEALLACTADLLSAYGTDAVFLEDYLSAPVTAERVLYLTFDVTVPPRGTAELTVSMIKDGSTDFTGKGADLRGYELMTRLGSTLHFTAQAARLVNTHTVELVGQNFGFDLAQDITTVTLDQSQDCYWLQVRWNRQ